MSTLKQIALTVAAAALLTTGCAGRTFRHTEEENTRKTLKTEPVVVPDNQSSKPPAKGGRSDPKELEVQRTTTTRVIERKPVP